jgi:hypothetical protein
LGREADCGANCTLMILKMMGFSVKASMKQICKVED